MSQPYVRHERGHVRPYLYGPYELPAFLARVFGATEIERHEMGEGAAHVELALGDAMLVVEAGGLPAEVMPTVASVYVYVEDIDAAYERALEAGATPLTAPEDKPYAERSAAFQDAGGNTWYISRFTG